jgi:vacuolar protein sorting-associated protein 29
LLLYSTGIHSEATPSFALLDIQGPVVVTYVYQLVDGEVKVDKVEYRKPNPSEIANKVANDPVNSSNTGLEGVETAEGAW